MKYALLIFILFTSIFPQEKKLSLLKINEEIKVDGVIEQVWNNADSTDDFFQLSPYYAAKPYHRTVVKVLTNETSLYVMFICYQKKSTLKASSGKLDEFTGDVVSIIFDSFNDKRTAYKLAVSASGVKMDARMLDDARNRDYSWDGVWFSNARIYDEFYVVEMEIPYKSIQFNHQLSEWGLDFDRWVHYQKEDLYWCTYQESEGQRISKFGKLDFNGFKPSVTDLNLEIFPVALAKADYLHDNKYKVEPDLGLDIFYNPSQQLTLQFTANPDFAQIEADPYDFNISRYESYFGERRPFFTQGKEVFMPSGKQSNSGFYSPLELFYSRRIGKGLPGGREVPLYFGTKISGRLSDFEYGGFLARTGSLDYIVDDEQKTEPAAYFGAGRVKMQILGNSSIGVLFVGKATNENNYGVLDIDGAFRGDSWQLAYQFARSFDNESGDYAGSFGLNSMTDKWAILARGRAIGNNFEINQIGFVPWKGTSEVLVLTGPRWYFNEGAVKSLMIYVGPGINYEHDDLFMDYFGIAGINFQFRNDWGFEVNYDGGQHKDEGIEYYGYTANFSSWFNTSSIWGANFYGGYTRSYNFSREYLANYGWLGISLELQPTDIIQVGTSFDAYVEENPEGNIEDITYNARPFFSITPFNNFNVRLYVDNVFLKSTQHIENTLYGFLLSYNFSPKSWIYFALNEFDERQDTGFNQRKMQMIDRAAVLKIKYLYYF